MCFILVHTYMSYSTYEYYYYSLSWDYKLTKQNSERYHNCIANFRIKYQIVSLQLYIPRLNRAKSTACMCLHTASAKTHARLCAICAHGSEINECTCVLFYTKRQYRFTALCFIYMNAIYLALNIYKSLEHHL